MYKNRKHAHVCCKTTLRYNKQILQAHAHIHKRAHLCTVNINMKTQIQINAHMSAHVAVTITLIHQKPSNKHTNTQTMVQESCGVAKHKQKLSCGFPPADLLKSAATATIRKLPDEATTCIRQ
jgi:hypothetical protein